MPAIDANRRAPRKAVKRATRKQAPKPARKPVPAPRPVQRGHASEGGRTVSPRQHRQIERSNRGRSDAGAPGGASGYRTTPAERAVRDRGIREARRRVLVKHRQQRFSPKAGVNAVVRASGGTPGGHGRRIAAGRVPAPGLVNTFPGKLARGTATALREDPVGTSKATARGFKDAVVGFPGAAVSTAVDTYEGTKAGDPLRGVKHQAAGYVKDVVRRYGPLLEAGDAGVREFSERVKKEGLSAEIFDATTLVAGGGGAASRALGGAARAGKLGKAAERAVTGERRRLRSSGGQAREQSTHRGLVGAAREKRRDAAARRAVERTVSRADGKAAARRNDDGSVPRARVDAVVREAHEHGDVVPTRLAGVEVVRTAAGRRVRSRRVVSGRKIRKAERVDYARRKGRTLHSLRGEERAEGVTGGGRGAGRAYAGLKPAERRAYAAAIAGARTPAAGKRWAEARIRRIEAAIERGDVDVKEARELPALRELAANPDRHFTPALAAVAAEETSRAKRVAAGDPALDAQGAEARRNAPVFSVLGVKRQGRTLTEAEGAARRRRDTGRKARSAAERKLMVAERRVGAAEETARRLAAEGKQRDAAAVERSERAVQIHERAAANHRRRAERSRSAKMREGHTRKAEAADERAEAASKRTAEMVGRTAASNPRLRRRVVAAHGRRDEVRAEIKRAEGEVKAAAAEGRKARALRRQFGGRELDPRTAEPMGAFLERGRRARDDAGFSEPGFFQSAPRETVRRSLFTPGGFRHVPRDKKYRGTLFEQGRQDGSFTTYAQGLARNIKRKHNWRLIEDTVREHSFEWGRNRSVEELKRELERRGIDPDSVAFWNPGVFREAAQAVDTGGAVGRLADSERLIDTPDFVGETLDAGQAQIAKATELAQDTGRWAESRDWVVVPKGVMDEIAADTSPSHWFWRGLDVVKGKQARILLGTSPAWLQFQVASNMLLTSMAGVGPVEIIRAQRWWRRLSDEQRAAVEPYVGVGHFHDSLDQVKIGAAANGRVLNAWRAFKADQFWHKPRKPLRGAAVSQLNPLDALFRLDNAQNNAFRKAVLYNRVKRDAYARMGAHMTLQQRIADRVLGHFNYTRPEETMSALVRDHRLLEKYAESVRDFLGDYQTYTARERRSLGRSVMFYGYLRFSLRFAFYTMPVKHPVMASILGQLGQLQTEEVRRLLGGDELPWKLGSFFYESNGKLKSVNVARLNPFLNTVTELDLSRDVSDQMRNGLRFLPPIYVSLLDQAFNRSSFTGKDFKVEGETSGRRAGDYGLGNRARIFLNDIARLNAIYREVDRAKAGGRPQGDDSLLGDRPTEYKRADIVAGIEQSAARFEQRGGAAASIKRGVLPLFGADDDAPQVAEKVREARGVKAPVKLTAAQRAELEKLRREARASGTPVAPDAAELEKLRREAAAAAG